ncbi:hypothetical protein [Azospirillum griseum]|uniref:Uncharacterized protein n=1 Tax=Azospirillum griseum TaxID=2496639 RepID=A0A3S0R6L9_9PROT|nr:hypothetical protein [Azospirillum griseum]RTR16763.1 hypothetical protein EJ903_20025 [Azospirillum griseum]
MGFSIASNAWGVHTILPGAMTEADGQRWAAAWREAVDSASARRSVALVADLRGLTGAAGEAVLADIAAALLAPLGRASVTRCAVLLADAAQSARFAQIAGGMDADHKARLLPLEGRDRVQIAAAYGWALNGTEPALADRLPRGALVRLTKTKPVVAESSVAVRRAS